MAKPDNPETSENGDRTGLPAGRADEGLRLRVLGPVTLSADGRSLVVGGPGARGLLLLLALGVNQVVSMARIVDGLWGDHPPASARTIVHGYVSRLRRTLSDADPDGRVARIRTQPPGYALVLDESHIDLFAARRLLVAARGNPAARRAELLRAAADLWSGPTPVEPPVSAVVVEIDDLRLVITAERIEAELELGRHAELVGELRRLVRAHPFDETLVGQLIRALHGSGQRAEALERYAEFRRRVADELGIDPGPRLRQLHAMLLRDELTPVPDAPVVAEPVPAAAHRPPVPAQLPPATSAFIGREPELAWLDRLPAARTGAAPVLAVVSGPAGVGKSALAITWGHRSAAVFPDGVLFAALGGSDPGHPPRSAVEVLPRFLLALGVPGVDLPDEPDEQAALYRSLLANRRMLVVLDDVRDSEHVRPLLPGGPGSLVVVTSRRRLDGLVASSGARRLMLGPLPDEPAATLIADTAAEAGVSMSGEQAAEFAALCGNLPLALRVVAARLAAHPTRSADGLLSELADERTRLAALDIEYADTSVRAALDVSYRGLHPAIGGAFRMLGLVPGPSVDPYVVAALCDTDVPGAARRLHALAEANLIEETGEQRYAMHDLVRLYAKELAATDRQEAHRGYAADQAARRLLAYYLATCDQARRLLYPPRDDLDFAAQHRRPARPVLARAEHALAWFEAEWVNLTALLDATVAADRHAEAWQLVALGSHYLTTRGRYPEWSHWAHTGLASARAAGDSSGEALMLIVLATARTRYGQAADALADARNALRVATELGDSRLIRTALGNVAGGLYWQGRLPEALACDQESYRLSVAADDRMGQAHALNNMAQVERELDRHTEAAEHARAAAELFAGIGDDGHHLMALNNLVELHLDAGRADEAEPLVRQALVLSATGRPDLQQAFARELHGRVMLAKGDPGAAEELRAALALTESLAAPRAAQLRELVAGLPENGRS